MRAALLFPLALALTISSASSADPPTMTTTVTPTMIVACTAAAANDSTSLGDKKSASIAPPNVTYVTPPKNPISYPCGKWVGDIEVASSAKPPAGYKNAFVVDVVLRPLDWVTSPAQCAGVKGNVEIYKKTGGGAFTLVGGGDVYGTWITNAGAPHCASTESPTFKRVNGSVPASGTETYRFVFPKTPAQLTGTIDRLAK